MTKQPTSIALVTPGWPRSRFANGVVSMVDEIAPALRERGCRTIVLCARGGPEPGDEDVRALPPHKSGGPFARLRGSLERRFKPLAARRISGARRVLRALEGAPPIDLLEMEESFGFAGEIAKRSSVPVVVCIHGPWFLHGPLEGTPRDERFHERVRAEGEALRVAAGVLAPSKDVLDRAREYYGLELPEAEVIPNPVQAAPPEERWNISECQQDLILFVGRFDRHKGGDVMIDAFARVTEQLPRARLFFAGEDRGVTDDSGREWKLAEYVEHRLPGALASGQVECPGVLPPEKIAELRRSALVTVSASRYENFAVSVLEALSFGSPLIVADEGGLKEVVGEGGLVVRAGDPDDLGSALLRFMQDPELAARYGQAAFEACEHDLSPAVIAARRIDFYARVLQRHHLEG